MTVRELVLTRGQLQALLHHRADACEAWAL